LLAREADRIGHSDDAYLYHEHLEQTNIPLNFHQFMDRAERAGLQYLAEASLAGMMTMVLPPQVAETLERLSPDILHFEQYMDFVRNRQFRQTLLCHRELRPQRALTPAVLHGLALLSCAAGADAPPDLARGNAGDFPQGQADRDRDDAGEHGGVRHPFGAVAGGGGDRRPLRRRHRPRRSVPARLVARRGSTWSPGRSLRRRRSRHDRHPHRGAAVREHAS
jgi:predicted methyltransferase family protein